MRFPLGEPEITALAQAMINGFEQAPEEYPALPVPVTEMQALLEQFILDANQAREGDAVSRDRHSGKDVSQGKLTQAMKKNIRYAESLMDGKPGKLDRLGWGPRRRSAALPAPGAVPDIQVRAEGDTWLILEWQAPVEGGPVGAYKVQRKRSGGTWEDVATALEKELLVSNQPRGVEFEFRVLAVNKAGTGHPSATVTAVL